MKSKHKQVKQADELAVGATFSFDVSTWNGRADIRNYLISMLPSKRFSKRSIGKKIFITRKK